jgi:hypothetical protein
MISINKRQDEDRLTIRNVIFAVDLTPYSSPEAYQQFGSSYIDHLNLPTIAPHCTTTLYVATLIDRFFTENEFSLIHEVMIGWK